MYWNKRFYFDVIYGDIIQETGGFQSKLARYSVEHEVTLYPSLSERNRDTFDYVEINPGQYDEEFAIGYLVRVNPQTKVLEFIYQNPNPEEPPEPQKPLTEQIAELKAKQFESNQIIEELGESQIALLELLIDLGVI